MLQCDITAFMNSEPTDSPGTDTEPGTGSARLEAVVPIVPVRRVSKSLEFYTKTLRFTLRERDAAGTFAYIDRDGAGLMLLDLDDYRAVKATHDYLSAYFWVIGIQEFYDEVMPRLQRLPDKRFQPLFTKPDGRREFHVTDPDGFLLFFGERPSA